MNLAEVVRDLNKGDDLMIDQSYSERQLFEKAYERLLSEFKYYPEIHIEETQKKLDKAFKRNLEAQKAKRLRKNEKVKKLVLKLMILRIIQIDNVAEVE